MRSGMAQSEHGAGRRRVTPHDAAAARRKCLPRRCPDDWRTGSRGGMAEMDATMTWKALPAEVMCYAGELAWIEFIGPKMSITAEQFYDAMGKIRADLPHKVRRFVSSVAALGVKADFRGALNLRWKRPGAPSINFGVVQRNGQIWTEIVNAHAPPDIAHRYIQELASAFSMQVEKEAFNGAWQVRDG